MKLTILIAEPNEVLCSGLYTIFAEDSRVAEVYKVDNEQDLQKYILKKEFDLVVVNQSLITNITALQKTNFAVLTTKPDIALLQEAYRHGAQGYLSVNVSAELLLTLLRQAKSSFLIEPALVPWIMRQNVEHV